MPNTNFDLKKSKGKRIQLPLTVFIYLCFTFLSLIVSLITYNIIPLLVPKEESYVHNYNEYKSYVHVLEYNTAYSVENIKNGLYKFQGQSIILVDGVNIYTPDKLKLDDTFREYLLNSINFTNPTRYRYDGFITIGPFQIDDVDKVYYLYFLSRDENDHIIDFKHLITNPYYFFILFFGISIPIFGLIGIIVSYYMNQLNRKTYAKIKYGMHREEDFENSIISEFNVLGRYFNQIISNISTHTIRQESLYRDITHELKTPLTRINLAAQSIAKKYHNYPEIDRIKEEVSKIDNLILHILESSKQKYSLGDLDEIKDVNLSVLFNSIIDGFKFECFNLNIECIIKLNSGLYRETIRCSSKELESAIENVLRNAIKYTYNIVYLSIDINSNYLFITVEDDGIGVDDNKLDLLTQPFYRVDDSRSRNTGGTGLGLSITYNVIKNLQGSLTFSRSELGGLKVDIIIPLHIDYI